MMEIEGLKPIEQGRQVGMSNIGARSFAQGYMTPAIKRKDPAARPKNPNRLYRRAELARAPRNIRVLARVNRVTYKFAHQPHINSVKRWLDPEELQAYQAYDAGTQFKIRNQIKNTVRRKRQALCA